MPTHCVLTPSTGMSAFNVQPIEPPAGTAPSFSIPASANPGDGMLHSGGAGGLLTCGGYPAQDPSSVQFFIGQTGRQDITYQVTDTVKSVKSFAKLQFCLGATFSFTTMSKKQSPAFMLPNDLQGFAGLVPPCAAVSNNPPCLVSKVPAPNNGAVLRVLIPAIGDPWGRA